MVPKPPTSGAHPSERVPTALQLRALLAPSFDETAPRPRITPAMVEMARAAEAAEAARAAAVDVAPAVDVPAPRHAPDPEHPRPATQLFAEDSRVDIPAVGLPADLTTDHTVTMPLFSPSSGHRRAAATRPERRRRFVTLPVVVGVASLAVVVTGVVLTGRAAQHPAGSDQAVQATALGGYTGSDAVGPHAQSLSRSSEVRNPVALAAENRTHALNENNRLANSYDDQLQKNLWVLPITAGDYHLTARFGEVSGLWMTVHTGLDFACPTGTPIHAIANGTITFAGWDGSYGNKTVETLADGTEIWYAHQNEFGTHVGATVKQGQVIGYVGSTGNTTGPHVHIEVRPGGGDPVDPDPAFKEHGVDPDADQG